MENVLKKMRHNTLQQGKVQSEKKKHSEKIATGKIQNMKKVQHKKVEPQRRAI